MPKIQFKLVLIAFVLLHSTLSFSQRRADPNPEEVSQAKQLKEKYKDDKDVNIVVLNATETIKFFYSRKRKKLNIKRKFKEELMNINEHAKTQKYVFYDSNSAINGFIIKNKLNRTVSYSEADQYVKVNGLFYHDQRVIFDNLTFPMQGYKLSFAYEKVIYDPKYFTNVYFIQNEPILNKTIKFIIPKYAKIELKEMNFDGYNITKTQHFNSKKDVNEITYTLKNIPAEFNESHTQGPSYIYPHILVLIKEYTHKNVKHVVFNTTEDLYKWYHSLIKKMKNNPKKLTKIVKKLTTGAKNNEEKIKKIFYWVQDNIRYIAFEDGIAGFKPDECQNVYEKLYGDCKGMANLLTEMLKKAGFDARRTWIGTRRIAYDYSTPSLSVDNHMICTLFLNGKPYYLDATETYVPFGEYAERIQGQQVLIENGKKFMLKTVPVTKAEKNNKTYICNLKINGDNLTGNIVETYKGQSRTSFLQSYNSLKTDKKKEALEYYLKGDDGNYILSNIKTSDLTNREADIEIKYDFILKNAVSSFDNEVYIDIDYDKSYGGMDMEKRKSTYQFSYKADYNATITFEIPTGYKIAEKPENLSINNEDFIVDINFKQQGNKLIYTKKFIFPNALISKKNLKIWKEFYKKIDNLYQSQITLIKK